MGLEGRPSVTRGARDNVCPVKGCTTKITADQLGCRRHWFMLPPPMRSEIWRLFSKERGSLAHRRAVLEAIAWLNKLEQERVKS